MESVLTNRASAAFTILRLRLLFVVSFACLLEKSSASRELASSASLDVHGRVIGGSAIVSNVASVKVDKRRGI